MQHCAWNPALQHGEHIVAPWYLRNSAHELREFIDLIDPSDDDLHGAGLCGACAKCAFVFLLGAAHTDPVKIRRLMGANLLDDLELIRSLADPNIRKPLECVGTKEEVWVALEDIWQKQIWRDSPGLKYFAESIRPAIASRLPGMRKQLLHVQSLRAFTR